MTAGYCLRGALVLSLAACVARAEDPRPDDRPASQAQPSASRIDFSRDIRPILSNNCFKCHGPDADEREAGLRLDIRADAMAPADSGRAAIVPGKAAESGLVRRVFSSRKGLRMPPAETGKTLTVAEKDLLRKWVEQGAEYQAHWAFVPPVRPEVPKVKNEAWPRNPIDRFILARLESLGRAPSPEADRTTLIRRLTFDLTGLPPTLAEVDEFLADRRPDAYERVVDRLLASPHYGERMALEWLDAARFADTHGFHIDSGRDMTRWRQWVIDAFNRNLPFDEFTVDQLAGDLLPDPTLEQRVATGFNRNHMINFEGGAVPEEYQTAYIVDRVNTTATVWLGLTVGCAQCHDHKYDPIKQKDYYQFYAFFNNVPENGLDGSKGNAQPFLHLPSPERQAAQDAVKAAEKELEAILPAVDAGQADWEKWSAATKGVEWSLLDPVEMKSKGGTKLTRLDDKTILASGPNPANDTYEVGANPVSKGITAIRLEAMPDESLTAKGPGRSVNGNIVLTDVRVQVSGSSGSIAPRLVGASADFSQEGFPVALAVDDKPKTGWAILPEVGKPHTAIFELDRPIDLDAGGSLIVSLDFQSQFPQHQLGKFRLAVTTAKSPLEQAPPSKILAILALGPEDRSEAQKGELRTYYRSTISHQYRKGEAEIARLRQKLADVEKSLPSTMVMQEMPQPRDTFMLTRGQYDKKGEKVLAGVPSSLPPLPAGAPTNRLGLARWLVDPANPLTARVIVNRYWQMVFGTGLVKTSEDFGAQGEQPSHPELLDWLATEFTAPSNVGFDDGKPRRWNVKAMIRAIVTSAAYRQSSSLTGDLAVKDPENRWLARGARVRLPAEFIRDQALAVGGLLNTRIGGPSVSPYQPPGLWEELASRLDGAKWSAQVYTQGHGPDLYRRSMYTYWKRTSPPPTLVTFDAPDRETCTVRRSRTNTPLQALILLNDPTYVEASRKLAERIMTEPCESASVDERIALAFRLATARRPTPAELEILRDLHRDQLAVYRRDPASAKKLLAVGESKRDEKLDVAELAAWTTIASAILNLDETVTKG